MKPTAESALIIALLFLVLSYVVGEPRSSVTYAIAAFVSMIIFVVRCYKEGRK